MAEPNDPESPQEGAPQTLPSAASDAREQRRQALHDLAQRHQDAPMSRGPGEPASQPTIDSRHIPRRAALRWGIFGLGLLCVLVVLTLIAHAVTSAHVGSPTIKLGYSVAILPQSDKLNCPVDVAWSPDNASVAVEGYLQACPNSNPALGATSGVVNIYSATAGHLLRQLQLDQTILNGHGIKLGAASSNSAFAPYIGYTGLAWSPDSKQLALSFIVEPRQLIIPEPTLSGNTAPRETTPTVAGVLLMGSDGGSS